MCVELWTISGTIIAELFSKKRKKLPPSEGKNSGHTNAHSDFFGNYDFETLIRAELPVPGKRFEGFTRDFAETKGDSSRYMGIRARGRNL